MRKSFRVRLNNSVSDYNKDYAIANLAHRFSGYDPQFTETESGFLTFAVNTDEHLTNDVIREKLIHSSFVDSVSSGDSKKRVVKVPQLREAHRSYPEPTDEESALRHLKNDHKRLFLDRPEDSVQRLSDDAKEIASWVDETDSHLTKADAEEIKTKFDPQRPYQSFHNILHIFPDYRIDYGLPQEARHDHPSADLNPEIEPQTFNYGLFPTDEQEYQHFQREAHNKLRIFPAPWDDKSIIRHLLHQHNWDGFIGDYFQDQENGGFMGWENFREIFGDMTPLQAHHSSLHEWIKGGGYDEIQQHDHDWDGGPNDVKTAKKFKEYKDTLDHAGILVKAKDTGRVLLIQKGPEDKHGENKGLFELPGGHIEEGEDALETAIREWEEEVGRKLPKGKIKGHWTQDTNGKTYHTFLYQIKKESLIDLNPTKKQEDLENPDNKSRKPMDIAAWFMPKNLEKKKYIRKTVDSLNWKKIREAHLVYPSIGEGETDKLVSHLIQTHNYRDRDDLEDRYEFHLSVSPLQSTNDPIPSFNEFISDIHDQEHDSNGLKHRHASLEDDGRVFPRPVTFTDEEIENLKRHMMHDHGVKDVSFPINYVEPLNGEPFWYANTRDSTVKGDSYDTVTYKLHLSLLQQHMLRHDPKAPYKNLRKHKHAHVDLPSAPNDLDSIIRHLTFQHGFHGESFLVQPGVSLHGWQEFIYDNGHEYGIDLPEDDDEAFKAVQNPEFLANTLSQFHQHAHDRIESGGNHPYHPITVNHKHASSEDNDRVLPQETSGHKIRKHLMYEHGLNNDTFFDNVEGPFLDHIQMKENLNEGMDPDDDDFYDHYGDECNSFYYMPRENFYEHPKFVKWMKDYHDRINGNRHYLRDPNQPHRHASQTDFAHGKGINGTPLTDTASNNPFTTEQGKSGVTSDLGIQETQDPQYIIGQSEITDPQRDRRLSHANNESIFPTPEFMTRENLRRHLQHDHGMDGQAVDQVADVLNDWANDSMRSNEPEAEQLFRSYKKDLHESQEEFAHRVVHEVRGGEWDVDMIRGNVNHRHGSLNWEDRYSNKKEQEVDKDGLPVEELPEGRRLTDLWGGIGGMGTSNDKSGNS